MNGTKVTTRVIIRGSRRVRVTEGDVMMEAEVGVITLFEKGPRSKKDGQPLESRKETRNRFSSGASRKNSALVTY